MREKRLPAYVAAALGVQHNDVLVLEDLLPVWTEHRAGHWSKSSSDGAQPMEGAVAPSVAGSEDADLTREVMVAELCGMGVSDKVEVLLGQVAAPRQPGMPMHVAPRCALTVKAQGQLLFQHGGP